MTRRPTAQCATGWVVLDDSVTGDDMRGDDEGEPASGST
jgi:hypothetical protein